MDDPTTTQLTTSSSSSSESCCSNSSTSTSSLSLSKRNNNNATTNNNISNRKGTTTTNNNNSCSNGICSTTKTMKNNHNKTNKNHGTASKVSKNDTTCNKEQHEQEEQRNDNNSNTNEQQQQYYYNYEKELFVPALMMRLYHLPGNTYKQDLWQYLSNNHPVIGICYHHKLHPVNFWERCLALIGSICFGLAITNIIYLCFVFTNIDANETYFEIPTSLVWNSTIWNGTIGSDESPSTTNEQRLYQIGQLIEQNAVQSLSVSNGNIALWTIGATLHALYDNMIWQLASYSCCLKDGMNLVQRHDQYGYRGTYLIILSVIIVVAITTFIVALRQAMDEADIDGDNNNNDNESINFIDTIHHIRIYEKTTTTATATVPTMMNNNTSNNNSTSTTSEIITLYASRTDMQDYQFLISYGIELLLTYFIYYPIVNVILFTGIFSCFGKCYYCGGHPYERQHYPLPETIEDLITTKNKNTTTNNVTDDDDDNEDDDENKEDANRTIPNNV